MRISEIHDGDVYSFERVLSPQDVRTFAELTGDFNPLHCDPETGRRSQFGGNIVHGMLAAGLFSTARRTAPPVSEGVQGLIFTVAPLDVTLGPMAISLPTTGVELRGEMRVRFFDFGAASVLFEFPIARGSSLE